MSSVSRARSIAAIRPVGRTSTTARCSASAGPRLPALLSIDGTGPADIYACGEKGILWHHDGKAWRRLPSPTSFRLNGVRCASPTEVYLCGQSGAFFRGALGSWEDLSAAGLRTEFTCIELFGGKVWLAGTRGLFVLEGGEVVPVDTGLSPKPDAYRLHANDGVLWSFGLKRLAFFDGKKWTPVPHPDNP